MSEKARQLKEASTLLEWHKNTTNEHPLELKKVWEHIVAHANAITAEQLCDYMGNYPFITILVEEDAELRGVKDYSSPEERYQKARIHFKH